MKVKNLLFTKEEVGAIEIYKHEITSRRKRLLLKQRSFIEKNREVIEDYFEYPRVIQIETIATCNAKCLMCASAQKKMTRKTIMNNQLFEKIIYDCRELKPKMIWPFLNGEPFLDPKIFDHLDCIEKIIPGQLLGLFTNASLLDEDKIRRLFDYNIKLLHISINAAHKKTYEKVMGLDYGKLLKNMEFILKYNKDALIRVSFVVIDENRSEVAEFKQIWEDSVGEVEIRECGNWGGELESRSKFYDKLRNKLLSIALTPKPCSWQIMNMFILSNGDVCHCCGDTDGKFIIGDANKEILSDIWKSKLNTDLRYKHLLGTYKKEIDICRNCSTVF